MPAGAGQQTGQSNPPPSIDHPDDTRQVIFLEPGQEVIITRVLAVPTDEEMRKGLPGRVIKQIV